MKTIGKLRVVLSSTLFFLSAAVASAGCETKDRPATPTNLKLIPANPPPKGVKQFAIVLTWSSPQIRTKPTYHDIHFRDRSGKPIPGMDVTGGAASPAGSPGHPEVGQYAIKNFPQANFPEAQEYRISMRARTQPGTEGCVSAAESETVKFCGSPDHPLSCAASGGSSMPGPGGSSTTAGGSTKGASGSTDQNAGCSGLSGQELAICSGHNDYRARHGVPNLTWDRTLAANAAAWVKLCRKKTKSGQERFCHQKLPDQYNPDACGTDPKYHYGENLAWGSPTLGGADAADMWYCEISAYFGDPNLAPAVCSKYPNPNKVTGHFTQLVWRGSTKLGCAQNTCPLNGQSNVLWACEYDPPGNFNTNQPGVLDQNVPRPIKAFRAATGSNKRGP